MSLSGTAGDRASRNRMAAVNNEADPTAMSVSDGAFQSWIFYMDWVSIQTEIQRFDK